MSISFTVSGLNELKRVNLALDCSPPFTAQLPYYALTFDMCLASTDQLETF